MAISKGPESRVTITSFAMQPPSQVLNPWEDSKIQSRLQECNSILFAAYRTSSKLRLLQEALKLNVVKLRIVSHVLGHHGLGPSEKDSFLSWSQATGVLRDVYSAGSKIRSYYSPSLNVEAYALSACRVLRDIFDEGGEDSLRVGHLKTFLVLLAEGILRDKLAYLFRQSAHSNANHCLSRTDLRDHLRALIKFPQYFQEAVSFGPQWIESAVASCFALQPRSDFINEEVYLRWQLMEPQLLVWLPTFYRQTSSSGIRHGIRCSNCRTQEIIGLRYQCLRCLNYNTCQHCFFLGHVSGGHKVHHPMQEYTYRSTRRDETLAFLKKLSNNLKKRNSRDIRSRYLRASKEELEEVGEEKSSGFHSEISLDKPRRLPDTAHSRKKEVKSIIRTLEDMNEKRLLSHNQTEVIHSVRKQLDQLKALLDTLFNESLPNQCPPPLPRGGEPALLGSTPLAAPLQSRRKPRHHLEINKLPQIDLSPIVRQPNNDFTSIVQIQHSDLKSSISCQDISSLLSKEEDEMVILTKQDYGSGGGEKSEAEILSEEEIQSLMGRLENVFKSIQDSPKENNNNNTTNKKNNHCQPSHPGVRFEVKQLVNEINDQMNSYTIRNTAQE